MTMLVRYGTSFALFSVLAAVLYSYIQSPAGPVLVIDKGVGLRRCPLEAGGLRVEEVEETKDFFASASIHRPLLMRSAVARADLSRFGDGRSEDDPAGAIAYILRKGNVLTLPKVRERRRETKGRRKVTISCCGCIRHILRIRTK
jgi:hypothetical protein